METQIENPDLMIEKNKIKKIWWLGFICLFFAYWIWSYPYVKLLLEASSNWVLESGEFFWGTLFFIIWGLLLVGVYYYRNKLFVVLSILFSILFFILIFFYLLIGFFYSADSYYLLLGVIFIIFLIINSFLYRIKLFILKELANN